VRKTLFGRAVQDIPAQQMEWAAWQGRGQKLRIPSPLPRRLQGHFLAILAKDFILILAANVASVCAFSREMGIEA